MLGLLGHRAADLDAELAEADLAKLRVSRRLPPCGGGGGGGGRGGGLVLAFDPDENLVFDRGAAPPRSPERPEVPGVRPA